MDEKDLPPIIPRSEEDENRSGVSRRDFLKGTGLAGAALTARVLLGERTAEAAAMPAAAHVQGPGSVGIALHINGKTQRIEAEPRVTLLDALRDRMGLTGAKKVCDRATCGSCTVLMDGKAVYSCTVLAIDAQGHAIETIEGIAPEGELHPISQAFVDHDAQQCGFCTPGFVMACKAYLEKNPKPTYEGVQHDLGGNLCRCGTYMGIRHAVLDAAKKMKGGQS